MSIYIGEPVEYNDMQGPAPDGFHVPLITEWQAIYNAGVSLGAWTSSNGTNFSTYLKMPMAGGRSYNNLSFFSRGSFGNYWSSTYNNDSRAYSLDFNASNVFPQNNSNRSLGLPVRCIKNSPTIPTSSWTTLYQGSGSAGIFHNQTDGLISISSDGTNWYTIMDMNLGATTVYNYGNTMTEANCGKVYQRGNNYAFSGDVNYDVSQISKSSTQVNVTGYGPGNYYESSTWITTNPRQSSANNGNNLRGGVSQGSGTKSGEVQNIYIGEYSGEPITTAGIYRNETQGVISLSSNGSTWITIADKNLGATQVYNYGDTLSESNCGKWYQWGNNYGFSYSGTPSSSTTQLDISSYGPNNYLNSSTFRKIPSGSDSSWRPYTPSNYTAVKNLWGGYTDTLVARRGPCDEGWHIPSYTEANNINTMLLSIFGISSFNSIKTDVITYLKRPAAGTLNGFLTGIDGPGNYLKTMISDYYNGSNSNYYCFEILLPYTSSSFVSINSGSYASTIRPFKNESVQPTSKWTKLK